MIKRLSSVAVFLAVVTLRGGAATYNFLGFETGDLNEAHTANSAGTGATTVQTTRVHSGTYGADLNCPASTDTCSFSVRSWNANAESADDAVLDSYVTVYYAAPTLPAANDEPFLVAQNSSGTSKIEFRFNSSGMIVPYIGGTVAETAGTHPVATSSGLSCIQIYVGSGASNATYSVKVDEVTDGGDSNNNLLAGGASRWIFGKNSNRNSQIVRYYIDDIVFDNAAQPPCGQSIARMDPDSDGATTTWTIGAGAGADWENVDDVPPDNSTTYLLSTGTAGNASTVGLESATSAAITGAVNAVKSFGLFVRNGGTNGSIQMRLASGSNIADATASTVSTVTPSYSTRSNVFVTEPVTGNPWSTTLLNSLEVGAVEASTNTTRATVFNAHVLFTPSGGGPPPTTPCLMALLKVGVCNE